MGNTALELTILRKTTEYMLMLRWFSEAELDRLRVLRRYRITCKHRMLVMLLTLMFVLPALGQFMCDEASETHLCHPRAGRHGGYP